MRLLKLTLFRAPATTGPMVAIPVSAIVGVEQFYVESLPFPAKDVFRARVHMFGGTHFDVCETFGEVTSTLERSCQKENGDLPP